MDCDEAATPGHPQPQWGGRKPSRRDILFCLRFRFRSPLIFKELKIATKNFNIDSLVGKGESGKFFMGWMDEKALTSYTF